MSAGEQPGRLREAHRQGDHSVRLDWGPTGADAIVPGCAVAVVVDVLSFTTTLTVAADRGTRVHPYPWRDGTAADYAAAHDAVLAVGRSAARHGGVSLSPAGVRAAVGELPRLVLPSPNGSAISARLRAGCAQVIGLALRNRAVVADRLLRRRRADPDLRVAVVAAGERWPDGGLRPAVEDLWGAGALVAALAAGGWTGLSPEAVAAAAAFTAVADDIAGALAACAGGRELAEDGFAEDVRIAAELDTSRSVPVLDGEAFVPDRQPDDLPDPPH